MVAKWLFCSCKYVQHVIILLFMDKLYCYTFISLLLRWQQYLTLFLSLSSHSYHIGLCNRVEKSWGNRWQYWLMSNNKTDAGVDFLHHFFYYHYIADPISHFLISFHAVFLSSTINLVIFVYQYSIVFFGLCNRSGKELNNWTTMLSYIRQ